MKKLIFCCLVVLMGACKDDKKDPEPEVNYAAGFVGTYSTTTIDGPTVAKHQWVITEEATNQLAIKYTKNLEVNVSGTKITVVQEYPITGVKTSNEDTFEINQEVQVTQTPGSPFKQTLSGVATRIVNSSGVQQINITARFSKSSAGGSDEEQYLEFKKN